MTIGLLGMDAMVNPHPKAELGFNPSIFEWHFRSETSLFKEDFKELVLSLEMFSQGYDSESILRKVTVTLLMIL